MLTVGHPLSCSKRLRLSHKGLHPSALRPSKVTALMEKDAAGDGDPRSPHDPQQT